MSHKELEGALKKLASRAASDAGLKTRLLTDAMEVLRAEAVEVPSGMKVLAVLDEDSLELLLLPAEVGDAELTIAELEGVAGGDSCGSSLLMNNTFPNF